MDRTSPHCLILLTQSNPSPGASEYFQRTENIAGVKVGDMATAVSQP